jgi:hypothetical protein
MLPQQNFASTRQHAQQHVLKPGLQVPASNQLLIKPKQLKYYVVLHNTETDKSPKQQAHTHPQHQLLTQTTAAECC